MSHSLVEAILAAAGRPVPGDTLDIEEMRRAVREGRVLRVHYWSNFGQGEASFGFATTFGLDGAGRVHPSYLVFPKPIPPELRRTSATDWESVDEVFTAFGILT